MILYYFSGATNNTHRFVAKLSLTQPAVQIPLKPAEPAPLATEPYILLTSTYGGGGRAEERDAVPKQVIRFLNVPENRALLRGVVASGNMNFGHTYALAADVIARKCSVPILHKFEILGTPEDVSIVNSILESNHDLLYRH